MSRNRSWRMALAKSTSLVGVSTLAIATVAAIPAPARADDWTGTTSSDWFNPANWLDGSVPAAADPVAIDTVTPNPTVINGAAAFSGQIDIGMSSVGNLTIAGGGTLNAESGRIGTIADSQGAVTVTGSGSRWDLGLMSVGQAGTGTLTVSAGGVVSNSLSVNVGSALGSQGNAAVTGPGSLWTVGTDMIIGNLGTGSLSILDGGTVEAGAVGIGQFGGGGAVTVSGAGSVFDTGVQLSVARTSGSNGSLRIEAGGVVTGASGIAGVGPDSDADILVTGAGSRWDVAGTFNIGQSGTAVLNVADGGAVSAATNAGALSYIGSAAGSSGSIAVTGAGSTFDSGGTLNIGRDGSGTLLIENGATGTSNGTNIAANLGSSGVATVSGADSSWNAGDGLSVGDQGSGALNVEAGGIVINQIGVLGAGADATGTALVTGVGSRWINSGDLQIGRSGSGEITVEAGGELASASGTLGIEAGGQGVVTVTGAGSTWINSLDLTVAFNGAGTLTIADGGSISNRFGRVGSVADSDGDATVTGPGSTWTNSASLVIGGEGTGALTIENGGTVSNTTGFAGAGPGSEGSVTVAGADSTWTNSGALFIGDLGTGTLTIADEGVVNAGTVSIAGQSGSTGTLNIGAAAGDAATAAGTLEAPSIAFGAGAGTINFNHTETGYEFASAVSGAGSVNVLAGTTVLTGASTYTGATNVNGGTLRVEGSLGDTATTVADGATLGGSGSIPGDVTIQDGGTLAPGSSAGTLTVGSLSLSGGSVLDYELGQAGVVGGGVNDLIEVTGNLILDGTLNITDIGGFGPGVYRLMNYGGNLADHVLELGGLPAGVDASDLYVQTRIDGQVNLINSAGAALNFWDGGDAALHDNGANDGGSGVWDATNRNWTEADGAPNGQWNQDFAIFGGMEGTVTVDNSAGAVLFTGIQFMTHGYVINGDALTTNTAETIIRVDPRKNATIAASINGAGGLVKTDDGALILTGVNGYTGGTTISQGAIVASVSGALGTGPVTVGEEGGNVANLDFTGSANAGSLDISVADQGLLWFRENSSAGAATINNSFQIAFLDTSSAGTSTIVSDAGHVTLIGSSTAANAAINLTNGGAAYFSDSATAGSATITNTSGIVGFFDNSTADGATIANRGQVDISGLTADGIGIGSLSGTGTVYLGSKALTLGGLGKDDAISGTLLDSGGGGGTGGSLIKTGAGTLTLTGANSYTGGTTVEAGRLDIGGGGATGSILGNVDVAAGGTLAFNRSNDFAFAGTIGGDGTVEKLGAGAATLTGNSSAFAGTTSVNAGTLVVDGTLGGVIDVLSGARLEGTGTVGTTTVASGGTIAPGNSIDTLSVAGDITFAAGSTYEVEIEPDLDGDLIDASGAATIDGGTVHVLKTAGTYTPGSRWTIVSADGGVAGEFDDLTQNMPFVDLALAYDPNNVYLDVTRNDVSFCDVALTFNQCSTGDGLESTGPGTPIYDVVAAIPDEESARQALSSLSGEIHASIKGAFLEDSRFVREAALDRTRAALGGVAAPSLPVMGYGSESLTPQQQEALAREGKSARVFAPAPADTDRFAIWARGFGSWGEWDSDGNAADFERATGGIFVGADAAVAETWRVGLVTGYSRSSFHDDDRASSGDSDNYHLGLFAGTSFGNLGLSLGAAHTWHDIVTGRSIAFPGFADSAQASYDARTAQAFGELGYRIASGNFAFEPFANLAYVNVHTSGFSEEGGAAALASASSDTDATFTTLGLRAATDFRLGGVTATARGMLGWRHAFGDTVPNSTHAFAGGDSFTIAGTPIAEDALVLEAGLDVGLSQKTSLGLSYSGQIGDGASDHGFRADLSVKF